MAVETFTLLVEAATSYGRKLGIGREFFIDLYREKSDWAFIIQIDALNETFSRETLSRLLEVNGVEPETDDTPADFVNSLGYQGRTSIIRLLKLAGVPKKTVDFVECVRMVRNAYAHDIRYLKRPMLDIINERPERARILRRLSYIEEYDEAVFVKMIEEDGGLMRFVILQQCMTFLLGLHQTYGRRGKRKD